MRVKRTITTCDKCNREYTPKFNEFEPYIITAMISEDEADRKLDLCPECRIILGMWLDDEAKLPISKDCATCKHEKKGCDSYPCIECYHNHANLWEAKGDK